MKKILLFLLFIPQFLISQNLYSTRLDTNDLYDVYFLNANVGFIMGENGTLLQTENGGQDWYAQPLEVEDSVGIRNMVFLNDTVGFIVGDKASLFRTFDAGFTWEQVAIDESGPLGPEFGSLRSISFHNGQIGWIAGDNGEAQLSTDQGDTWIRKETGQTEAITGILSLSDTSAMAVLENGVLIFTEDQGETWMDARVFEDTLAESPAIFSLFGGENKAWVAGAPGPYGSPFISFNIEISNDWMLWDAISSPVVAVDSASPFYTAIHFSSVDTGWVIGWDRLILHTENGGQSWTQLPSPDTTTNELNGLTLRPDSNEVWIVGNDGLVISTVPFAPVLSLEDPIKQSLQVYPNPCMGSIFIQNPFDFPREAALLISDLQGKVVVEKPLSFLNEARKRIDLADIPQGMYIVQLLAEGELFKAQKLRVGAGR